MSDEDIRQAMRICYEADESSCERCPIRAECRTIDADTLGEIFIKIKANSEATEEEYDDV